MRKKIYEYAEYRYRTLYDGMCNLLLKNFHIVTLIQIVFSIPYVIIGIRNIKGKKIDKSWGCRLISCRFAGCSYETTCCRIASSGVSPTFSSNMIQSAEQSVSG